MEKRKDCVGVDAILQDCKKRCWKIRYFKDRKWIVQGGERYRISVRLQVAIVTDHGSFKSEMKSPVKSRTRIEAISEAYEKALEREKAYKKVS